jgi:hypothetical protein
MNIRYNAAPLGAEITGLDLAGRHQHATPKLIVACGMHDSQHAHARQKRCSRHRR